MSEKPKFVYITYIRTTPEKLWAALTDPATIKKFWFGITADSDFKPGSPWRLVFEDGRVADTGKLSKPCRASALSSAGGTSSSRS